MLIDVHVNLYRCNRIVSVDASTLHVVVERLQSDLFYKLYSFTDQGQMLIRSSESMDEMLDLYDSYMKQAEEKRKAAYGGQLSFEDIWEVTAVPDDLIKKSIRLPADLDEYVNSQKGTTWTDKLCRILEEYRSGDETRAEYMADYEKRMAANRKKIQEQNSQIYTVARSLDHLHRALEDLNSLPFT